MLKNIILFLIFITSSTYAIESRKYNFNLHNVNKIIIGTYQKIVITRPEEIKFIINELSDIKEPVGIDTITHYNVFFYEDDKEILVLGLYMDFSYPGSSFIRHHTKDNENCAVCDYLISRSFFDFLKSKLRNQTKVDTPLE